jgi:ketopantoate reductase
VGAPKGESTGWVDWSLQYGNIRIPAEELLTVNITSTVTKSVDWVIVALKSSSLEGDSDLIYHMLTPNTKVLVIMNGLSIELIRMLLKKRKSWRESILDRIAVLVRLFMVGLDS